MSSVGHDQFLLMFAPEHWSPLELFIRFNGLPYPRTNAFYYSVRACDSHIRKFKILANLANRIYPSIDEDLAELEKNGYTNCARSNEYSAVVETLACELYASLDCLRTVLFHIYRQVKGIQDSSTQKLFNRAKNSEYGPEFPEQIRTLLAHSTDDWFPKLCDLRTELTHGGTGSCHKDKISGTVHYMHEGLGDGPRAYVQEDIAAEINKYATGVTDLIYSIFSYFYTQLENNKSELVCGIYKGRFYQRLSTPEAVPTRNMGTCLSAEWFHKEPDYACPRLDTCKAYKRFQQGS
jgi:hypothetical protein